MVEQIDRSVANKIFLLVKGDFASLAEEPALVSFIISKFFEEATPTSASYEEIDVCKMFARHP